MEIMGVAGGVSLSSESLKGHKVSKPAKTNEQEHALESTMNLRRRTMPIVMLMLLKNSTPLYGDIRDNTGHDLEYK